MSANTRYPLLAGLIIASCVVLTGCARTAAISAKLSEIQLNPSGWITPYRSDVVQGNFLSSEQVALLRPGLSRNDVRNLLGTPLVTSLFHADRWDYAFSIRRQGVPQQNFQLTLFFKGDVLQSVEGSDLPSESEFVGRLEAKRKGVRVPNLQASEEDLKKFPSQPSSPVDERKSPLPASYPPLEPAPR